MHTRGRRLASDGVRSVTDRSLQKKHRRQAASYQTTCKPLKKLDFVGADLSAKRPVHSTHMRWLKHCIRGQVRSYQTTYNLLKKLGFVGADRATFRLSAKRPVHPTHMRWLKHCIRGQVRSHDARCLMRDSATSKTWWRLPQSVVAPLPLGSAARGIRTPLTFPAINRL